MARRMNCEATLDALGAFADAVAEAADAEAAFRAAELAAGRLIGHRLFTVMAFHADTMEVERCYSSAPLSYPLGARKRKRGTPWSNLVLEEGRCFIGRDADEIRRHFSDHEIILGLGLGSVLNVPIRASGRTIGTMNLLDEAGRYDPSHVAIAKLLSMGLIGPLRAHIGRF
ncbi:MAG: GAF domain-containing protein [Alphaproteobacteria bacterium]|nr:MAG: GAF domain-containing protein [Alphaproteobacteria bacterium]